MAEDGTERSGSPGSEPARADAEAGPDSVYALFRRGSDLLEHGDHHGALIPLGQAAARSPGSASIREAHGRALFHTQQYGVAALEFGAVVEKEPTNDFALFCLGRCLQQLGRHREARPPLTLAARLRPAREDYRRYAEAAARASGPDAPNPYASRTESDAEGV